MTNSDTLRRFRVDERLVRLLRYLDKWTTLDELEGFGLSVEGEELEELAEAGVVERSESGAEEKRVDYWNTFDLAVQRLQSRGGRDVGVTGNDRPPPVFKQPPSGRCFDLPEPPALPGSLTKVLNRRRSRRHYSDRSLRLRELSGVLYHSVRVTATFRDDRLGDGTRRPFPSGGARSELEIYVVANDIIEIPPGAYYYDAYSHRLIQVRLRDQHQSRLNRWLYGATGSALNREPHAVLLITAVFSRVMWKYRDVGLPLIYRNAGSLYQTLYLIAEALELAPCGIGAGEESRNARWLGLDPRVESQVGCFLLGARLKASPL